MATSCKLHNFDHAMKLLYYGIHTEAPVRQNYVNLLSMLLAKLINYSLMNQSRAGRYHFLERAGAYTVNNDALHVLKGLVHEHGLVAFRVVL